ncbi:MAG TPA: hypothetical protein VFN91_13535 [Myxococcaceae bacterium]|nr:hypothetical protein [Myxococcaceae bacterium]
MIATEAGPVPVEQEPRHHVVFRNDLVEIIHVLGALIQAWHLAPGETTPVHRHSNPSLLLPVNGGRLTTTVPAGRSEKLALAPGDFRWSGEPLSHALANGTGSTLEIVELELR